MTLEQNRQFEHGTAYNLESRKERGEDREGGMEEEGGRNRGREGEGGSSLVVEPHPRAAHKAFGSVGKLDRNLYPDFRRTSLLKRKHNNVIPCVHIAYSQHTILHQPAIGRQQQSGRCPCACCK